MSLRARLLTGALRLFVKPALRYAQSPRLARKSFALSAKVWFRYPRGVRQNEITLGSNGNTLTAEVFSPSQKPTKRCILYFHGGGYIAGSPNTHRALIAALAKFSGYDIVAPFYPLAPENPAPAQFDQALASWQGLITLGYDPTDIVIAGDSAGGGLALALLAAVCEQDEMPAGAFAFSPWTDLTGSSITHQTNRRNDPIFPGGRLSYLSNLVRGELATTDPRISPIHANYPNCPPVLLFAGSSEILLDDTTRMVNVLQEQGANAQAVIEPNLPHVWSLFHGWIPEADKTIHMAAKFTRQAFEHAAPDDS